MDRKATADLRSIILRNAASPELCDVWLRVLGLRGIDAEAAKTVARAKRSQETSGLVVGMKLISSNASVT